MYAPAPRRNTARAGAITPYGLPSRVTLIGDGGVGFIDPVTAYTAFKTGENLVSTISNFFGNDDAKRQQRIQWFVDQANKGSVIAANVIVAGPNNVGGNEAKQWRAAAGQIPASVLARTAPGGYWPSNDPDWNMTATRQMVLNELTGNGSSVTTSTLVPTNGSSGSPFATPGNAGNSAGGYGGQMLPAVMTTAKYNYMPIIVGVIGVGALAVIFGGLGHRGRN